MLRKILHKIIKSLFINTVVLMLTLFISSSAHAAALKSAPLVKPTDNQWRFLIIPYAWLPWIDGDITVKGQESSIKVSPGDLIRALQAVFQLHAEAAKGNWSFMVDPTYVKLKNDVDITGPAGLGSIGGSITNRLTIVDFGVYYKFLNTYVNNCPNSSISLEALLGGRYMKLEASVNPKRFARRSASKSWADPIIGSRLQYHINQFWTAVMYGDIGGFGVSSHFTWAAKLLAIYKFNKTVGLAFGIRALGTNYSDGHGANKFKMDTTEYGPTVGITIRF